MFTGVTSMTPAAAGDAANAAAAMTPANGNTANLTIRFMTNSGAFPD
jgi:hypothetical protein